MTLLPTWFKIIFIMKALIKLIICAIIRALIRAGYTLIFKILFIKFDLLKLALKYICADEVPAELIERVNNSRKKKKGPTIPPIKI